MWKTFLPALKKHLALLLMPPSVALLVISLRSLGWLQSGEWMAYDQFMRLRPPAPVDPRITIVGIEESDLQYLRRWPITDDVLANLLQKIKDQKPSAIGLDLYRDFPVETGYPQLTQVFKTTPNLIGIEKRGNNQGQGQVSPSPILKALGQTASNDFVLDGDGKLRRGLLYWTNGDDSQEFLALRLALIHLEKQGIQPDEQSEWLKLGHSTFRPFEANDGSYINADAGNYSQILNYRGAKNRFQRVSLQAVLKGTLAKDTFKNRIVLIGTTTDSIKDEFYTPYSGNTITTPDRMYGVEAHAQITSQILSGALGDRSGIKVWNDRLELLWIGLWATVGLVFWRLRSPSLAILSLVGLESLLGIGSYLLFLQGWWIPVVPPAMALALTAVAITGYIAQQESLDRATVMNLFGRYVTPTIAEAIWQDREQLFSQGRLKGKKIPITALFTDLKDFSTIAEQTDPEVLMDWLNEYMAAMTQVVLDHGAVVDKFIGDAVMALFGVPLARTSDDEIAADAQSAVSCAIGMAQALNLLNQKWKIEGRPTLQMRVGICTGLAVTGSLGGRQRMDYTAIGDTVNIAARLESFDKSIEGGICRVLVSDSTYQMLGDRFTGESIGSVHLKGRAEPTLVYQIFYPLHNSTQ
jgi:adenylate cyclase